MWIHKIIIEFIHTGAYNLISRDIYDKAIERIELIYRLIDVIVVKMSYVGVMIPPLINTAVNYFVYDLKDESFLMPRPMWCVENRVRKGKTGETRAIIADLCLFFQGYRLIGRPHRDIWLHGLFNPLVFRAYLFPYQVSMPCSVDVVGYSLLRQKILQLIYLNWYPKKLANETIGNWTHDFLVLHSFIRS